MAEDRNIPFQFKLYEDVLEHARILANEANVGNFKIYITRLVLKHAKRISKNRIHAKNPIPCKLIHNSKKIETISLILTQSELETFRKTMKYHYYYNSAINKYQNSRFIAALIEDAWLKRHPDEIKIENDIAKTAPKRKRIDLTGDDDFDAFDHDGEDWSGED